MQGGAHGLILSLTDRLSDTNHIPTIVIGGSPEF